jgi:hypothetical protein
MLKPRIPAETVLQWLFAPSQAAGGKMISTEISTIDRHRIDWI